MRRPRRRLRRRLIHIRGKTVRSKRLKGGCIQRGNSCSGIKRDKPMRLKRNRTGSSLLRIRSRGRNRGTRRLCRGAWI